MLVCVYDKINGQEIVSIHLGDGHEESQVSFFFLAIMVTPGTQLSYIITQLGYPILS